MLEYLPLGLILEGRFGFFVIDTTVWYFSVWRAASSWQRCFKTVRQVEELLWL